MRIKSKICEMLRYGNVSQEQNGRKCVNKFTKGAELTIILPYTFQLLF